MRGVDVTDEQIQHAEDFVMRSATRGWDQEVIQIRRADALRLIAWYGAVRAASGNGPERLGPIATGSGSDTAPAVITVEHPPAERIKDRADRYERALKAIGESKLTGADFGDWVQAVIEDVLSGYEAECLFCETAVHDGPCVGEEDTTNGEAEPPAGGAASNA